MCPGRRIRPSEPQAAAEGVRLSNFLFDYRGRAPLVLAVSAACRPIAEALAGKLGGDADFISAEPFRCSLANGQVLGAVCETGHVALDSWGTSEEESERALAAAIVGHVLRLLEERNRVAPGTSVPDVGGRIVILVGEATASGSTFLAALRGARSSGPSRLVAAVTAGTIHALDRLKSEADEVICLETARSFGDVGRALASHRQPSKKAVFA